MEDCCLFSFILRGCFAYAEFASMVPVSGSAYTYSMAFEINSLDWMGAHHGYASGI
jgi:hypothetical protein